MSTTPGTLFYYTQRKARDHLPQSNKHDNAWQKSVSCYLIIVNKNCHLVSKQKKYDNSHKTHSKMRI